YSIYWTRLAFINPQVGWIVGAAVPNSGSAPIKSRVLKTSDGGQTWNPIDIGVDNTWPFGIAFTDFGTGWIVGTNGTILKTGFVRCQSSADCNDGQVATSNECLASDNPAYNLVSGESCASDCQSLGGYCGDGRIQGAYEQCDDGNRVDTDACTNTCLLRTAAAASTRQAPPPSCGDSEVQPEQGEECDLGGGNGVVCAPAYGRSCTYCSRACQVLTKEPSFFCGNGRIDIISQDARGRIQFEACDVRVDPAQATSTIVVSSTISGGFISDPHDLQCPDRGVYRCEDSCRRLVDNCVNCGLKRPADGGTVPKLAILNPLVVGPQASKMRTENWAGISHVALYVPTSSPYYVTIVNGVEFYDLVPFPLFYYRPFSLVNTGAYLSNEPNHNYELANFLFVTNTASGWLPLSSEGIETDPLCRGIYSVMFDLGRNPVGNRGVDIDSEYRNGRRTATDPRIPGDKLDYPVNGERGVLENEVVVSPPVPPQTFRIVVRWGLPEQEQSSLFSGMVYHQDFGGASLSSVISETRAVGDSVGTTAGSSFICSDMWVLPYSTSVFFNYWWPYNCQPYLTGSAGPSSHVSHTYVHPIRGLQKTFTQAMTVYAGTSTTRPFAFFVEAVGRPIAPYKNSRTLQVEVYEYHPGQNRQNSIFRPRVFDIYRAAETSDNPQAEYWHVFNIGRANDTSPYTIQTFGPDGQGSIETDFCAVLANVPGETACSAAESAGLPEGAPCTGGTQCAAGLQCLGEQCVPSGGWAAGRQCTDDVQCATGLSCNAGRCGSTNLTRGQSCNANNLCAVDLTCVSGVCKRTAVPQGEQCGPNDICLSTLQCLSDNRCHRTNLAEGAACTLDGECASLTCRGNVCVVLRPDLLINNVAGSRSMFVGDSMTLTANICNRGTAPTTGSVVVRETITLPGQPASDNDLSIPALAINACVDAQPIVTRNNMPVGTTRVDFAVDPGNQVAEGNEGNNSTTTQVIVGGLSDLRMEGLVGPPSGQTNQTLSFTGRVCNRGTAPVGGSFIVRASSTLPNGVRPAPTNFTIANLVVNACATTPAAQVTPTTVGTLRVDFVADPGNFVSETDESDLSNRIGATVNITNPLLPDIFIQSIVRSTNTSFNISICNQGTATVTQSFRATFIGTKSTGGDMSLSTLISAPIPMNALPSANSCAPLLINFPVSPAIISGVKVLVDDTNLIRELDENNNTRNFP
ncbi:MAG: hypothetical protein HY984_01630, partial [Candidatus Magasanikbacteria bacterium]|nr:hypothetical protein [Candidatus Magasanikbacteria bacterium]